MKTANIHIRRATMDDFDVLLELAEYLDAPHREALPDRFRRPDGPIRRRDHTEKLMSDPDTFLAVAELDGRVVGIINSGLEQMPDFPQKRPVRSALVRGIVVRPECRRQGVATALMAALRDWAREKGAREVQLNVYDFNRPAAAFCAALGYRPLSHRLVRRIGD